MARAIWSGAISFGLVTVPVKLFTATEQKDIRFNQFERDSGQRIRYQRISEQSGEEVAYEDIVKGYEIDDGRYVIVTPDELEGIEPRKSRTIDIENFIDLAEIDPIYFEKTYYLAPAEDVGAEKPYALLHQAMRKANKVAVGRFVMRTKEYLAAIRPQDGVLCLETMYFPDEVRAADQLPNVPVEAKPATRELRMAEQLIDSLTAAWDPSEYRDTYRERVLDLIERKAKGEEIVVEPEAETPEVVDLMDALRASVEAARGREGKKRKAAS